AAQTAAVAHEDHNFWIDQRLFYHARRLILEFGQRLAQQSTLEAVDDVFYLTPEELQNGRDVPMERQNGRDVSVKRKVQERKTEMEYFSHVTPPPRLGT